MDILTFPEALSYRIITFLQKEFDSGIVNIFSYLDCQTDDSYLFRPYQAV